MIPESLLRPLVFSAAKLAKADYSVIEKNFVPLVARETQVKTQCFVHKEEDLENHLAFLLIAKNRHLPALKGMYSCAAFEQDLYMSLGGGCVYIYLCALTQTFIFRWGNVHIQCPSHCIPRYVKMWHQRAKLLLFLSVRLVLMPLDF